MGDANTTTKLILNEIARSADSLNHEFLNSSNTDPSNALKKLASLKRISASLRTKIFEFKRGQKIMNDTCRERGLIDSDQMKDLRTLRFSEVSLTQSSLAL